MSIEEQSEFMNVVFDSQINNFESELGQLSTEKMMSIQYSEEILQNNFNIIIKILKQLHKGQAEINIELKDHKEQIEKLKKQNSALKEKVDSNEIKANQQFTDQKAQHEALKSKFEKQDIITTDALNDHGESLIKLTNDAETQKYSIQALQGGQSEINNRVSLIDSSQKSSSGKYETILDQLRVEFDSYNAQITQLSANVAAASNLANQAFSKSSTQPTERHVDTESLQIDEGDTDDIRRRMNRLDQEILKITELSQRLTTQEEETQRIWERLSEINQGGISDGGVVDSIGLETLKSQLRSMQNQIDQIQTSMNLMGAMSGGGEVSENSMGVILQEINKIRIQLEKYVLVTDFHSELQKVTSQNKKLNDMVVDSTEKVRRDLTLKNNQKLDVSEAIKIVNEINFLKEQLTILMSQKNTSTNSPIQTAGGYDPNIANKIRDMSDQLHNLENEVKNHRISTNSFINNTNTKITEMEKKIQSLQLDRIFSEMQILREMTESIKKDSDQNLKKIKELRRTIDTHVGKEEMINSIDSKIQTIKDDYTRLFKDLLEQIGTKSNLDDLSKVEQNILTKIEEIVQALIKQLANKQETKKALIYLEQKINQIFLILEGDGVQKEGDGLFTKRPMLWSCASCDKELDKFKGQLGEYKGWAVFPPKETSPERMGRFGVGYKNMQEKVKNNRERLEKERERYSQDYQSGNGSRQQPGKTSGEGFYQGMHGQSQSNVTELPKINQSNK